MEKQTKIVQITAGRGPVECCRVVAKVLELILKDASKNSIVTHVLNTENATLNGTLYSAIVKIESANVSVLEKNWKGTIQWIAQSPYRKFHKRKNWFVGVEFFDTDNQIKWNEKDVVFESCRASGPGGQHVNKTESAIRGTHKPSGMQVLTMDSRSQLQNKKLCLERLKAKVLEWQMQQIIQQQQTQWQEHNALERGNPVKVIEAKLN
jgi:peptide chain release factor